MVDQEGKYNIKAVSKIVGIQPGTLRAWERRYRMIAPIRNELGYRLYSEEHVKVLKWLLNKVNKGFTIGQAVSLLENQDVNLEQERFTERSQYSSLVEELFETLLGFNELKAQGILNTLFSLFTIEKVIYEIFCSLINKAGEWREARKITSAQEQFILSIIRARIDTIFHSLPQNEAVSKAILVCSPGEYHEIGLLMFALYLRRKGLEVIYLGTGVLEEDLEEVVKKTSPNYLFISCSLQENLTTLLSIVTQLTLNYKNLIIGIGGKAVDLMKTSEKEQFSTLIVGPSLPHWEKWLPKRSRRQ